jgi:hypothetical protein
MLDLAPVWRARRFTRRLRGHPLETVTDEILQSAWFIFSVPPEKIGYGTGLLTGLRARRHRRLARAIRIAILDDEKGGSGFGRMTAHWINERSRLCSATVNTDVEKADVVWVQTQDPVSEPIRRQLLARIAKAAPAARILNHPDFYNAYHEPDAFARLEQAGVRVPRSSFDAADIGRATVVYKQIGAQAAPKTMGLYEGEKPGHRTFEFIDSRGADGRYTRYRAFALAGAVRPSKVLRCGNWNVCLKNRPELSYSFDLYGDEVDQIRAIAETLRLDYFAVDFLRRAGDGRAFFLDINVYPTNESLVATGRSMGYRGRWHTFDTRFRLGMPEPGGRPFPEIFDEAMQRFVGGELLLP